MSARHAARGNNDACHPVLIDGSSTAVLQSTLKQIFSNDAARRLTGSGHSRSMKPAPGLHLMVEGSIGSGMSENDATLLNIPLQSLQPLQFFARTRTLNTQDERARPDKL